MLASVLPFSPAAWAETASQSPCINPFALRSLDNIDFSYFSKEELQAWNVPAPTINKLAQTGVLFHEGIRGATGIHAQEKLAHSLKDLSQQDMFLLFSSTWNGLRKTIGQRFNENTTYLRYPNLPEALQEALFDIALHFYPNLNDTACPVGQFWKNLQQGHLQKARIQIAPVLIQTQRGKRDMLWVDKGISLLDPGFQRLLKKNYPQYWNILQKIH